ncbi:YopT-type cysteine protease domain-containing protein [Aquabacter sp. P-9]|uniref:YopT-type cysteine protease domain-containing protein n=1 Tax=Aquabacter sediminis TaxID=3029197 RepID=UPI00237E7EAC|nr:YopT-type cysteine protease domain-containing protein [Aquabacter sp. P-9]MDE1569940.1 YopT-type cysteine protease domain-containing protein [Aquabacter sp. P-9]
MKKSLAKFLVAKYDQLENISNFCDWRKEDFWDPAVTSFEPTVERARGALVGIRRDEARLREAKGKINVALRSTSEKSDVIALKWKKIANAALIKQNRIEQSENIVILEEGTEIATGFRNEERELKEGICLGLSCKWLQNFNQIHQDDIIKAKIDAATRIGRLIVPTDQERGTLSTQLFREKISDFIFSLNAHHAMYKSKLETLQQDPYIAEPSHNSHINIIRSLLKKHKFDATEHYIQRNGRTPLQISWDSITSPNSISNALDMVDGSFFLLFELNRPGATTGSAHATCGSQKIASSFWSKKATLSFFDPNFGEFFSTRSQRTEFLTALCENYNDMGKKVLGFHLIPLNRIP